MKLFWKRILCFRSLFLTAGLTGLKVPANVGALLDLKKYLKEQWSAVILFPITL